MSNYNFKPVVRFIALSDVHYKDADSVERERMSAAIRLGYEVAEASDDYKSLDALYVIGDFTNRGTEEQMTAFHNTLAQVRPQTEVTVSLASHEFGNGETEALERFDRIFAMQPDTHKVINGFHFISVTTTNGCHFSREKIDWVARELESAAADDPHKPIFFFQHPHVSGTVYGSINWGEDELYPTLMNYPQIIDFSGHSHAPVNDPRSIHQKHFTCLGTGSLSYFELDEFDKYYSTCPPLEEKCAQMLIVEADAENRVRVRPYDILTESFFPCEHIIEKPWEPDSFVYTDARYHCDFAPYFPENARITAQQCDDGTHICFTQAKCDREYVNSYTLSIRREDTNTVVKRVSFWSEYYFSDMPDELTVTVNGLKPKTAYRAVIEAEGFWHNSAQTPLELNFITE